MKIEVIEVETKLQLLAMNFSNSYFSSMQDQYQIVFKNSNVVEEMETLDMLSIMLHSKKPSTIINKDRALLSSILESYTYLIAVFKALSNVTMLSPKFKRYEMIKYLQDWCKTVSTEEMDRVGVKVVAEILNSDMAEKINSLAKQINPDLSQYKSAAEKRKAKVKAEVSEKLLKK